jgi:hypothetical protein
MTAFAEQRAQLGVETTVGSAVPATRRLASGTLTIADKRETEKITPSGEYWTSLVYQKHEHTEGSFEGTPCYRDLRTLLALALGEPETIELDEGAAYEHTFTLQSARPTVTIEYGDELHGSRATGVFASSLELEWSAGSGDSKISMDLVGGPLEDYVTLTEDAEAVQPLPIIAETVRVYVDSHPESIGTTQLTETLGVKVQLGDIAALVRYLGAPPGRVNTRPSATVELVAEATTRARELRATEQVRYVRIEATGVELPGATVPASLTIDLAAQTADHSRGEEDAVYAVTANLEVVKPADNFVPRFTLVTDQP